jgi:hypothetical protein
MTTYHLLNPAYQSSDIIERGWRFRAKTHYHLEPHEAYRHTGISNEKEDVNAQMCLSNNGLPLGLKCGNSGRVEFEMCSYDGECSSGSCDIKPRLGIYGRHKCRVKECNSWDKNCNLYQGIYLKTRPNVNAYQQFVINKAFNV